MVRLFFFWSSRKSVVIHSHYARCRLSCCGGTKKIIIDTDPGHDDAIAILLALASPELDVIGVTCVAGNVPLHLTARNALLVCELAGRPDKSSPDVTVLWFETCHCRGHTWRNWIGWTAMDPPTGQLQDQHAVDWLVETLLNAEDKEITLCPVGPLTNIAMALVREPKIASKVDQIVSMGGGYFVGGNITPGRI